MWDWGDLYKRVRVCAGREKRCKKSRCELDYGEIVMKNISFGSFWVFFFYGGWFLVRKRLFSCQWHERNLFKSRI